MPLQWTYILKSIKYFTCTDVSWHTDVRHSGPFPSPLDGEQHMLANQSHGVHHFLIDQGYRNLWIIIFISMTHYEEYL